MNKISNAIRNTVLGVGLTAAFFISCEKANAVVIKITNSITVRPANDSVFKPPPQSVTGSADGIWGIFLAWDANDLAGQYEVTAKGVLTHPNGTADDVLDDVFTFENVEGGAGLSPNQNCFFCFPSPITGTFGEDSYSTSFLVVATSSVPSGSPAAAIAQEMVTTRWKVVPWETDAMSLIVTTGLFLGGIAIKGKLAKKNLDSISEEPKI